MNKPSQITLRLLLGIQAIFWCISGGMAFFRNQHAGIGKIISGLMILDGLGFALFTYLGMPSNSWKRAALIGFLLINTILTLTDQMGPADYLILIANLVSLLVCFLLIRKRKHRPA